MHSYSSRPTILSVVLCSSGVANTVQNTFHTSSVIPRRPRPPVKFSIPSHHLFNEVNGIRQELQGPSSTDGNNVYRSPKYNEFKRQMECTKNMATVNQAQLGANTLPK